MIGPKSRRRPAALRGAALVALLALAGCGGGAISSSDPAGEEAAPIALTPKAGPQGDSGGALAGKVDDVELRKAIDRYRIVKQRGESTYDIAGVDLTGDGRPEALVLFTGGDWCQKTGCSLVVFQKEQMGYKPVSHITSARGPVLVGRESNFGWRELIVKTGGGGAPQRDVRLVFAGKGYPGNALLQPEATRDMVGQAQQILVESPVATASPAAGDASASGASN